MQIKWFFGLIVLLFAGLFFAACSIDGIADGRGKGSFSLPSGATGDPLPANRGYRDILPVSGGWIAVGELYGRTLAAPGAVIAKYDSRGTILWEKAFGGSDMDIFYSVIEIADGYLVSLLSNSRDGDLTGIRQDTRPRLPDITVKYDKNGTLLWAKDLNIGFSTGVADAPGVIANDSGFLAIVGIETSSEYLAARAGPLHITQFDTNGNVIWEKSIGGSLEQYGERYNTLAISKIFAGPDGYFLLGQAYYFYDFYLEHLGGPCFIVSIDEDGNFRWQKAFQGPYHRIYSVIMTDNGLVVAGSTPYNGDDLLSFQSRPFIEKFDFELNSVWNLTWQKTGYNFGASDMAEIDGNVFAIGNGFNSGLILGVDTSGEVFWNSELRGEEGYTTYYHKIFRQDDGFRVYRTADDGETMSNSFLFFEVP